VPDAFVVHVSPPLPLLLPPVHEPVTAAPDTRVPLLLRTVIVTVADQVLPAVLTEDPLRLATCIDTMVSVSVALLFAGLVSVTPAGAVTVAVLDRVPAAALVERLPLVVVKVTVAPTGILTVRLMLPLPVDEPLQVAPPVVVHVQLMVPLRAFVPVGKLSTTVAPVTALGPALLATMV